MVQKKDSRVSAHIILYDNIQVFIQNTIGTHTHVTVNKYHIHIIFKVTQTTCPFQIKASFELLKNTTV